MRYLLIIFLAIMGSLLYAQFSSDMGNVWIRTNSLGVKEFRPDFALDYILQPFKNIYIWIHPELWILNTVIWIGVFSLLYFFMELINHQY